VRGNGKIIQELEGDFRGAGWNVIKLIWGSGWDKLLEQDDSGRLRQLMDETVDGDYQTYKSRNGAYIREHSSAAIPRPPSSSRAGATPTSGRCAAAATTRSRCSPPSTAR
jgi:pyruvate dehydrogenase complex dehydrogenase (E1) component